MLPWPASTPASRLSTRFTIVWNDSSRLPICAINSRNVLRLQAVQLAPVLDVLRTPVPW